MILLKQLLQEITLSNVAPYATEFDWDTVGNAAQDTVECKVICDGIPMVFNFGLQWGRDDELNYSFSIIAPSTDPDTGRRNWSITHSRSDAAGKLSYLRLMRTVTDAILDFVRIYSPTSIDVTGSDNLPDKDMQKTRIYRALLAANSAELATAGYTVLDRSGKLYLVRRTRADASGIDTPNDPRM